MVRGTKTLIISGLAVVTLAGGAGLTALALPGQSGRPVEVRVGAATTAHPPADSAARQTLEGAILSEGASGQNATLREVKSVQIKGSTWGQFLQESGYGLDATGTSNIALPDTPIYIEMISGSLSFDESTPAQPDPGHQPWMVQVVKAAAPYQPLFQTAGNPGGGTPAWFTSMVDQSVPTS